MKQKRLKRKTCSLLLAAAMIITSFPVSGKEARAAGTSGSVSLHSHDDVSHDTLLTTDGGTLATGNYYLDSDIELSRAITINGTVNLCLNGHTLNGESGDFAITVGSSATLNLYDCGTDGKITGHKVQSRKGAVVHVNGGTFNMHNGTITGAWIQSADGGGVYVNSGTFNMSGGTITNNQNQSGKGGGVYVNSGTFHMSGGIISNNKSNYGVYLQGGAFTVSGAPVITQNASGNVYLPAGKTITVTETLSDTARIGVTTATLPVEGSPVAVTGTNSADYSEYFVSDKGTYKIQNSGDGSAQVVQLVKPHVHSYTYSGDGAVITESCTCGHSETAALSMADGVNLTYTGNAIEACRITYSDGWAGGTLNLSYLNNTNAGRATATILKNGETASLNFEIAEKSLTGSMITLASGPHYYTGSAVEPAVTVKDGIKTLESGTDYTVSYANNTNVGTATVTVTGTGNYTGTINKNFTITGKSLTDSMITLASGPHYYTGSAVTPAVTVKDGSKTLVSGTDYTVSYTNNTNVGTATATVTVMGKGNYTGTIEKTFDIILTDADQVAAAKEVVMETLGGYTATNSTTKQEIQEKIDTALSNAGISGVDVTVGDIVKTEATTDAEGSISGSISITKGSASDSVTVNKTIEKLPKTEAEKVADAKKVVEETLAGITATNSTTKQEIQEKIDIALTQAGITEVTVTVGELAKTEATTEAAGSISGTISIVSKNDSGETDSVPIIKTIEKLPKTETEKVADAKKVVEEILAGITATNSTTKQEIQDKIDEALTQAGITEVTVTVGDLEKTEATTEEEGSISGSITLVSDNDSDVTDSVPIIKTIEKLPKTEAEKVADAKKVVEETLAGITATNNTTKQEILDKIDTALTQAGITEVTVTVGELAKTEATTEATGSISGTISIVSKKDSGETDSVPIIKTIEKLPKTEAEKVADAKKVVEETLAGITATNSTTKQEIQEKIDAALTQAGITEVTVTVGELAKTEATTEAAGSIGGTISIVSKNDSSETDNVPIIKTIEKLPKTEAEKVAGAKKVVEDVLEEVLAGITTASDVTSEDIQREIDEALTNAGITDVTVTVGDLTKTEATAEEEGSISGSITLVSDNDSDVTDSVPIHKTIAQLHTHSYTWIITKEATADEEGEMTGTCICGEVTTETIPRTGESGSGTVIVKEDEENECNGSLEDKEDVKGKVSLTDTEKEQLNTGEDLVIILRLRDVDVAVDTQEKTEIQDKLEVNTLGTFLDIELLKQIGGTETKITETTDEIEITFEIPEHLRNTDDTMTRTYQIMRHHDGVVDILDVENYDETAHLLTFKTDKFSTYALVYRDAAKNPTDTPGPTETPGTPSPTPVTTETPGIPTATPITTETPDTSTPTPVPTNTPGISTATPITTETPGTPTATPITTETPDTPSPSPVTTETPGTPTATPGPTGTPGTPLPTPGTTATPEIVLSKDALSLNALLNVNQTGKKINIAWGKVAGADGYDVYVQYCGKEFTKKSITAIKSGKTTKVTVKKVNGKALNQKKIYKIYVLAYKLVNGKKITLAKTITAHIAGKKNAKYTNVKVVKVRKSSYSLKQGKTAVIKASTVLESKGKKQLSNAHAKEFRYATDNKEVATVSKKGKIKAVGKGSCTIYVYARNGCAKKIKVKVK